jgi:hypothetical protein
MSRWTLLIILLLLLLVTGCQTAPQTAVTPTPDRDSTCAWFDCGTLHFATQAEWQSASDDNQIATAASFADLVWVQLFGEPADFAAMRAGVAYRAFVSSINKCINTTLFDPLTVEQVGPECALSVPIMQ